jgi:hypothetical protein
MPLAHLPTVLVESDGEAFSIAVTDGCLVVTPKNGKGGPRVIPWVSVLNLPAAWAAVADGKLVAKYTTERQALDKVADLRSCGAAASVVEIPH